MKLERTDDPERVRTNPASAPTSHASAASRTVINVGARNVNLRTATCDSCRHARASANDPNVRRIGFRSRTDHTCA